METSGDSGVYHYQYRKSAFGADPVSYTHLDVYKRQYMWRMKYQEIVTPDSFYVGLTGLEQWAKQTKQPMDLSLIHI